ncbi:MAG: hypothetical protein ACE5KF_09595 [Kiloniellaceae bacterium]
MIIGSAAVGFGRRIPDAKSAPPPLKEALTFFNAYLFAAGGRVLAAVGKTGGCSKEKRLLFRPKHFAASRAGVGAAAKDKSRGEGLGPALLFVILLILVSQAGLVVRGDPPILDGGLTDPDGYMRLNRVQGLWQTGAWFDPVYPRINPPAGHAQHWTRPLDMLLLAGAWLASPVLGFEKGLFWWGVLISPVLQILSLFALAWAAIPVLGRQWLWLLGIFFVVHPGVFQAFMIGRPDHQSLILLLCMLLIGLTIRLLLEPERGNRAIWAGVVTALAIWVSIETMLVVAIAIASLGLFWLSGDRRLARILLLHAVAVFLTLAAALLVERGVSRYATAEFDTFSIAHVFLFGLNLALWFTVESLQRLGAVLDAVPGRLLCALLGAVGGGLVLWLVQPGFFESPLAHVDDLYRRVRLVHIKELEPALALTGPGGWTWQETVAKPIFWLGTAVPAVPWLIRRMFTGTEAERRVCVFFALGIAVFVPLTIAQLRWVPYAEIFLLVPYAWLAGAVLDRVVVRLDGRFVGLARPLLVAAFCLWFYLPKLVSNISIASGPGGSEAVVKETELLCPIKPLAEYLSDPTGLGAAPKRLLAFVDFGPELLYRTPHSVLSIPNHRFQPGFTASYRIMTATDFSRSQALLRAFKVDLVVICPGSVEASLYDTGSGELTLYQALSTGGHPGFLEPVALPEALSPSFKMFAFRSAVE